MPPGRRHWNSSPLAILALLPASEAATSLANLCVTRSIRPSPLPALDLATGVPPHLRTLVAVPVLLTGPDDLAAHLERLEVHHLSSVGGARALRASLGRARCRDRDHRRPTPRSSPWPRRGSPGSTPPIPATEGNRFLLLHRQRRWNASEHCWMGWERKRGKLAELNRLLRGAPRHQLPAVSGAGAAGCALRHHAGRRYPPAARCGAADDRQARASAEPAPARCRGVAGHRGLRHPAATGDPALPVGQEGSLYQRISSAPGGIEPYAAAISDVYQDLFGEGSFTGKGIYDIDAFAAALEGRVPENAMLSHDLFEGIFARAALASDVEVVEDFPARHDVAARAPAPLGARRLAASPLGLRGTARQGWLPSGAGRWPTTCAARWSRRWPS